MEKEAKARIKINKLLEDSGWRFFDDNKGKANIDVEGNVKIESLGEDFESTKNGFMDYLLNDTAGFPLCVLEAKSESKDPLDGKEQARRYARSAGKNVRFIILSNGNLHYFWDLEQGNPTGISKFPKPEDLDKHRNFTPDAVKLYEESVEADYIARSQKFDYDSDPRWYNEQKKEYAEKEKLRFLRPYQLDAITAIQNAVREGKNRFLLEMATGTGKTLLSAAIIKMFLRTGNARRVLFLVDRIELERQGAKNFRDYLSNDFQTAIFKEKRGEWKRHDIVVTTIQSIAAENRYLKIFNPTDFDLIISDEAHRSISGGGRAIFEYFLGYKLGLTATPKDYLKNVNIEVLTEEDPRELERRTLLSTYKTFGCETGSPTYRYVLNDGVKDGYLIPPIVVDCRTDITTELLSEEGYAAEAITAIDNDEEDTIFKKTDFERRFFSEETNYIFAKTFLENALRDPITNEIGKGICFCVSRKHAAKMTEILNRVAMDMFPGKYQSDFATQITSNITGAQDMTTSFANNKLNNFTRFLEGYESSRTRIAVTVGMMTTGYDCPDLLNIALMRPIFSPTDFIQIKGRGTRPAEFIYEGRVEGELKRIKKEKTKYKLFDFFGNVEYFEKDYPYDEVIKLPVPGKPKEPGPEPLPPAKEFTSEIPDPLKTLTELYTDSQGLRIDREFGERFIAEAGRDPDIREAVNDGDTSTAAQLLEERYMDKPEMFYTLEKLREAFGADHRITIGEVIDYVYSNTPIPKLPTLADREFEKFSRQGKVKGDLFYEAKDIFNLYLLDEEARTAINKNDLGRFTDEPETWRSLRALGKDKLKEITDYIKDNVRINTFLQ